MQPERKNLILATLQQRTARTQRRLAELRRIENRFPWIRLGVLIALLLAVYLVFQLASLLAGWVSIWLAFLVFGLVAMRHRLVAERIARLEMFERMLQTHSARLRLDWEHIPAPTQINVPREHPFSTDLDITGARSLHQLLDTSVSVGGSQRLADWLLAFTPDPEAIARRQGLVIELGNRHAFRTRLELDGLLAAKKGSGAKIGGAQTSTRWDTSSLLRWLEARRPLETLRPRLIILFILAAANISLFILNQMALIPPLWMGTFILYFGLLSLRYRESSEVFAEAYALAKQLESLRAILVGLETYPYQPKSRLAEVCAPFWQGNQRPGATLRRIGWIVSASALRDNPFLSLLLNMLLPWDLFLAYQLERYKIELEHLLPVWLERWYEVEALSALATFAELNPANTFPRIQAPGSQPVFEGVEIGHPLIPDAARVDNDFSIQALGEVEIITGSNMSGKSTFLRTLGINLVLAYAGSSVAARSLRALPFRVYTSMNVSDSLNDGISFFYAEVKRLKTLLDQLNQENQPPLFFLIDEIFRGTNNRERQIGSHAYTKSLAGRNGAGLISTHDLELARLADSIPLVHNQHFREDIEDGKMIFDFKIRQGPSPTTNALQIMALAGLPVEGDGEGIS